MIDARVVIQKLENFALKSGYFSNVSGHEPKSSPQIGDQVNVHFIAGPITPATSGLNSVSLRWEIQARVFMNADSEPADEIDPALVTVTLNFMMALCNQFKLTADTRCIDVYGSDGDPLRADPGYYKYESETLRVMDIFIPVILNDQMDLGA